MARYSGVDWSGTLRSRPGNRLAFAAVHMDSETRFGQLEDELLAVKRALRLPEDYVFKHDSASPLVKERIFSALDRLAFSCHVLFLEEQAWRAANPGVEGDGLLRNAIVKLVIACPDAIVGRNVLLIDPPSTRFVNDSKTPISRAFRAENRSGYKRIRDLKDTHPEGAIIQVADMIAGEARHCGRLSGPYLSKLIAKATWI